MDGFLTQLLNGLVLGSALFILSAGLSLIFGLMDVINLAHGAFYMLGAYLAVTIAKVNFWLALLTVPIIVAVIGLAVEFLLLRRIYGRDHLDQVLLTFGLSLIIADVILWRYGGSQQPFPAPAELSGTVAIFNGQFPIYRLFLLVVGLLLAGALWLIVTRTRLGAIIRAGVSNKEIANGLGINVKRMFSLVFAFGCALAAFGGVLSGPVFAPAIGIDAQNMLRALIIVVIGGLGSLSGAFWGSFLYGLAETFGNQIFREFSLFIIFLIMVVVLIARPQGLFGRSAT